jgi:hypothetical protein
MCSCSVFLCPSTSRNIDAIRVEPGVVSVLRIRSQRCSRRALSAMNVPVLAGNGAHSSNSASAMRSVPPAVSMSPSAARIRQVMPAMVAMNIHFSHMSCRMCRLNCASKFACRLSGQRLSGQRLSGQRRNPQRGRRNPQRGADPGAHWRQGGRRKTVKFQRTTRNRDLPSTHLFRERSRRSSRSPRCA